MKSDSEKELILGDLRKLEAAISSAVKDLRAVEEEEESASLRLSKILKVWLICILRVSCVMPDCEACGASNVEELCYCGRRLRQQNTRSPEQRRPRRQQSSPYRSVLVPEK